MAVATETGTLSQDGVYDAAALTWTDGSGISIAESSSTVGGFRFTGFTVGPLIVTEGTVTVRAIPTSGQVPCTLKLYAQGNSDSSAFSSSNGANLESQMSRTSDLLLDTQILTSAGSQTVTFDLNVPKLNGALNMTGEWQGALNLTLHARADDASAVTIQESEGGQDATLSLEVERRVFTGIDVDETTWRSATSRADICPITGEEGLREDWVWSELHRRFVRPGAEDPDTDRESRPHRTKIRLTNER